MRRRREFAFDLNRKSRGGFSFFEHSDAISADSGLSGRQYSFLYHARYFSFYATFEETTENRAFPMRLLRKIMRNGEFLVAKKQHRKIECR